MKTALPYLLLACGLVATGIGCFRLTPKGDPTRYFVLAALPGDISTNTTPSRTSLVIRRVHVPAYLEKRWIATRNANEIQYAADDEWAENLQDGMQRVLAANLTVLLRSASVALSTAVAGPDRYELAVSVERFELNTDGQCVLEARWELLGPDRPSPLRTGHYQHALENPAAVGRPDQTVQLQSELLADFSRQLARALDAPP